MLLFHIHDPALIEDLPRGRKAFLYATVLASPELLGGKKADKDK